MRTVIRSEEARDIPGVRAVVERAFEQAMEADLVDELRESCNECLALVAEDGDAIVGHVLFTPAVVTTSSGRRVHGTGMAPVAVDPRSQRRGIGSALIERGLELLRERGCPFVIVLGHPDYYPRFGFEPAASRGISCQWEGVPDEAFMVLVLDEDAMEGVTGIARYRDEFDAAI